MNNAMKTLTNGILKENPTFALVLGMCPTLATTTSAVNGMSMGLATLFVLVCSNVVCPWAWLRSSCSFART